MKKLSKEEARGWIQTFINYDVVIPPNMARKLYLVAGYDLPYNLRIEPIKYDARDRRTKEFLDKLEKKLFEGLGVRSEYLGEKKEV